VICHGKASVSGRIRGFFLEGASLNYQYRHPYLSDQRKFQRYQCNLSVFYKVWEPPEVRLLFSGREMEGVVLNVCEAGVGMLADQYIPKHALISLTIEMFKGNSSGEVRGERPFQIIGKVCYSKPSGEGHMYRLGVCFTQFPTEYKSRLIEFFTAPA